MIGEQQFEDNTLEQDIENVRTRIFEEGEYNALNNFSGNLPRGWRRAYLEQPIPETLEQLSEAYLRKDLKFFGDIDDAIRKADLDPAVIVAFNIASSFGEEMVRRDRASYEKFMLGRTCCLFPVYAILRRMGYSDRELCS